MRRGKQQKGDEEEEGEVKTETKEVVMIRSDSVH